jgi:hypothetical protein
MAELLIEPHALALRALDAFRLAVELERQHQRWQIILSLRMRYGVRLLGSRDSRLSTPNTPVRLPLSPIVLSGKIT